MINLLEIAAPTLEWMLLSPLLVILGAACLGVLRRGPRHRASCATSSRSALAALAVLVGAGPDHPQLDRRPRRRSRPWASSPSTGPTYFFWSLLLVFGLGGVALFAERGLGNGQSAFASSAATVPGSPLEREADRLRREHTEVFPLLLFALFGMMIFAAANDLLMLFVAVEIFSLPLYLLTGMARRRRLLSQEAALKYFLLGSLASAIMLYGIALLYGYAGAFQLAEHRRGHRRRRRQRRAAARRHAADRGRAPVQDRRRPVPRLDPRRVHGRPDAR